jgi:hypothetical protein
MVVWVLTAGIGIYLLAAGIAAQRHAGGTRVLPGDGLTPGSQADSGLTPSRQADGGTGLASAGGGSSGLDPAADGATVVGTAALSGGVLGSGVAAGGPGGGSRTPEGSPLLEFTHPLLAVTGLMFWIFYVMTDDRLFAWIAFGVVVTTVLAGVGWVLLTRHLARQRPAPPAATARPDHEPGAPGPRFPAHLVMIHGLAAACTFALVVIAAATAAHG